MIGVSHHFFLTLKKSQNSLIIANLPIDCSPFKGI
jgi:hypothetical protein